jgi:hypothetical protein
MGTLTLQSIPQQLPGVIRLRLAFLENFGRRANEINRDTLENPVSYGAAFDFKRVDRLCRQYQGVGYFGKKKLSAGRSWARDRSRRPCGKEMLLENC